MREVDIDKAFKYAIFAIPVTVLVILPSLTDPINLPKLLSLIPLVTVASVLFMSLSIRNLPTKNFKSNKYVLGLYGLLALGMSLSAFSGSNNYIRALFGTSGRNNGLIYYLSAIALAIVLLLLNNTERELSYLYAVIAFTAIAFGGYSFVQFLNLDPVSWSNPYNRVIGTLGNPNFASSVLASFSVFWFYLFFRLSKQERVKRFSYFAISVVLAFLSWATESIQGLLILGLGVSLVIYIYIREKVSSPVVPYVFFVGGGSVLIFTFAAFLGLGPLGNILEQYTLKLRAWYALFGIKAMFDSPWTGVGVDNYVSAFRLYKSEDFVRQYGFSLTTNNAHSTPVQIGASFGLLVFLLYCVIHILILYHALRIINSRDSSPRTSYFKGIAILWLIIFSQSILSIEIIGLGIMNWTLGAIILSSRNYNLIISEKGLKSKENRQYVKAVPAWTGSVTIVAIILGLVPFIPVMREDRAFQNVAFTQIVDEAGKVAVQENFRKLSNLTLFYPDKIDRMIMNLSQAGMGQEIENVVKSLYRIDSDDVYASDLMATFYANSSQLSDEILVRERMRKLDPWNAKLELLLAEAYFKRGDDLKLLESLEIIKFLAPDSDEFQQATELAKKTSSTP